MNAQLHNRDPTFDPQIHITSEVRSTNMNPNHGEDLPLDLKSLSIIIHYDASCPTNLRQTAHAAQQNTTMLGNSNDSPTESVQHQEQGPNAQNEADCSISSSEDESIIDNTFQNHKQKAQLYKHRELMEFAKEKLLAQAQTETAALHRRSKDTTTEQTEKFQQMIQEYINHNPLQTQQQAVSVYKHLVAVELRKGMYPGGLPEHRRRRDYRCELRHA
ncbi:uncharacterized protein EAE97_001323 [Botrytis byssoidea]|uniref:Uncharacterized protein n=1 Tax=Botrytis byssoidea TaxID=139641 RepID=A0A9P5IZM6_9HELO|nr:uncharacterized protein EAE97_001323 [Botrytis byssoidea]KAF7953925.1 hypothetical protein EAE97_001323 [Botrytis byssoidea]